MAKSLKLNIKDRSLTASLKDFFCSVLQAEGMGGLLIPQRLPMKPVIMPTLVTDPSSLDRIEPLAPVFPLNAAGIVSKLTRKSISETIAVVLRPCEIRAVIELIKLKQASRDNMILFGIDCFGAYKNTDYLKLLAEHPEGVTDLFFQNSVSGKGTAFGEIDIAPACKACEHPIPDGADISIGILGADLTSYLPVQAQTLKGEEFLKKLNLPEAEPDSKRTQAIESLKASRLAYRDDMFKKTAEATNSIEKLTACLAGCVNCYNCRVACPVCYCKECVFVTDAFLHDPDQYLRWAKRKKLIKMPTDTVFYHITRLAHMSLSCVGCGQCSNACPNQIPVMQLFRTVAHRTQAAFNYEAGRSVDEALPLSEFHEKEFNEVVGIN